MDFLIMVFVLAIYIAIFAFGVWRNIKLDERLEKMVHDEIDMGF